MTFLEAALCVVAVTVLSAHVAPSVDDNNRYLKVTPLGDGIRLAYTVFFGEIPGAAERRNIDGNHDGRIDHGEAKQFADRLGAQVAALFDVEVDGVAHRVRWDVVSAGMGSDAVVAGSFSVDLVAFVCGQSAGRHRVRLRDQFRIPRPGETELKVEDSPGVTVTRAHVGPADDPSHDFRFAGPGGPLSDDGLELEFTATDHAPTVPSGKCGTAPPARTGDDSRLVGIAVGGGAIVLGLAGLLIMRLRRR
jgi:hypothetical protein